jgi:hypothetical protein
MGYSNLPVVRKETPLQNFVEKHPMTYDGIKRALKVAGYTTLAIGSFGAFLATGGIIGAVPATILAYGSLIGCSNKIINNTYYKGEKDLLFNFRKTKEGLRIFQSVERMNDVIGASKTELSEMILLNALVGFSRMQRNFENTPYTINDKGQKVYNQRIITDTHGVVLSALSMLEKEGYISDVVQTPKKGINGKTKTKRFIVEKISMGNFKGAKESIGNMFKGDSSDKEDLVTISFGLTDKRIDFEKMYDEYLLKKKNKERPSLIDNLLFREDRGILAQNAEKEGLFFTGKKSDRIKAQEKEETKSEEKKTIKKPKIHLRKRHSYDIVYDRIGRPYIKKTDKDNSNFVKRREDRKAEIMTTPKKDIREELQELEKENQRAKEKELDREEQEDNNIVRDEEDREVE